MASRPALGFLVVSLAAFFLILNTVYASVPTESINWAGYIAASNALNPQNGVVTSVNGSWIVQSVNQTTVPYKYSSQWIGIDGATNQYLIQTGTESDSANNIDGSSYYAWWEVLPFSEEMIGGFTVKPGDIMSANIVLVGQNVWNVTLRDITRNEVFTTTVDYTTPESSAEWIDERTYVGGYPPLAQFKTAYYGPDYTGIPSTDYASINGVTANIIGLQNVAITMYSVTGNHEQAVPSALSSSGSFNVLYVNQSALTEGAIPTNSINWAGYIVASNVLTPLEEAVTMVNGTWAVQNAVQTINPAAYSAQWLGIDGATNGYLIQTGTGSDSSNAIFNSSYYAWYEILPSAATIIPSFTVKPGDEMYAKIALLHQSNYSWYIYLDDYTENEIFSDTINAYSPEAEAEWIDERPLIGGEVISEWPPLANFNIGYYGSGYTGIPKADYATINGVTANILSFNSVSMTMTNVNATLKQAVPSALTSSASFTINTVLNITVPRPALGIDVGHSATLNSTPFGGILPYTYQWYEESPGSSTWTAISGATSRNYTVSTTESTATGVWNFNVLLTDAAGGINYSGSIPLAINKLPTFASNTATTSSNIIDIGENFSVTSNLPINGTPPFNYTWYVKAPESSSFTPIPYSGPFSFEPATEYPDNVTTNTCVSHNGYIYCAGGAGSNSMATTQYGYSPNGNTVNWGYTYQYPDNTFDFQNSCVVNSSYEYCVGGYAQVNPNNPSEALVMENATYYTKLTSSGVSGWTSTKPYPHGIYAQSCVTYNHYIYCVNGQGDENAYANLSYYAPLSSNGIGNWVESNTFYPILVYSQACAAYSGYIYCVGGVPFEDSLFPFTNTSYYAPLASNGIGNWIRTTNYPMPISYEQCTASSGYIFCNSGVSWHGYTNLSYYAPISSNGIGNWVESQGYPPVGRVWVNGVFTQSPEYQNACTLSNGKYYCVGGCSGGFLINKNVLELICTYAVSNTFSESVLPAQYTFYSNSSTPLGTYQLELVAVDADNSPVVNSLPVSVTVNPAFSLSTGILHPTITSGTLQSVKSVVSGGTPPYTYNVQIFNPSGSLSFNSLGTNSMTANFMNFTQIAPNGNWIANIVVSDRATIPVVYNVTIDYAVGSETTNSLPTVAVPNSIIAIGRNTVVTANVAGGVVPYTSYVWTLNGNNVGQNANSITVHGNLSDVGASTLELTVTDSASQTGTGSGTVNVIRLSPLSVPVVLISNSIIYAGENETVNAYVEGGQMPYTYNYIISNSVNGAVLANALYTSVSSTSNTFRWSIPITYGSNTVNVEVEVTDANGTTTSGYPLVFSSAARIAGDGLFEPNFIAVSPNGNTVYATSFFSSTVAIINGNTNSADGTITVASQQEGVAFSPSGQFAYVGSSSGGNVLSTISTSAMIVVNTIALAGTPMGVAVSPSGSYVYVAVSRGELEDGYLQTVNTVTNSIVNTLTLGELPYSVALSPNGTIAYVTNWNSGGVSIINTATNTIITTVTSPQYSEGIAVSPLGTFAYVGYQSTNGTLGVINTSANKLRATPVLGSELSRTAVSQSGSLVYATDYNGGNFLVINPITNTVVNTLPAGTGPEGIAVSPSGYIYVSDFESSTVNVIYVSNAVVTILSPLLGSYFAISNQIVEIGQQETFNAVLAGGAKPFTYNFLVYNPAHSLAFNALYVNSLTVNALSIVQSGAAGTWTENVIVTDSEVPAETVSNSLTYTVNNALSCSIIPSNTQTVDSSESVPFTSSCTGGTPSLYYQWYSGNSAACTSDSPVIGALSPTYTPTPTRTTYYCLRIIDSASSPATVYTGTTEVIVDGAFALTAWSASNSVLELGQTEVFSASVSSGTTPYNYNILIYNPSGTLAYNSLDYGTSQTTNSFSITQGGQEGTWTANVTVEDGANAIYSSSLTYTVNNAPTVSIDPSTTYTTITGQAVAFNSSVSGGSGTFAYQWYSGIAGGALSAVSGATSNTYTFSGSTADTYGVLLQVTDTGTSANYIVNSLQTSVVVQQSGGGGGGSSSSGGGGGGGAAPVEVTGFSSTVTPVNGTITIDNHTIMTNSAGSLAVTGYHLYNQTEYDTHTINVNGNNITITVNFITPTTAGISINNVPYTFSVGQLVTINDPIYVDLVSLSYIPIEHTIDLDVFVLAPPAPNATTQTTTSTTSTTTVAQTTAATQTTNAISVSSSTTIRQSGSAQTVGIDTVAVAAGIGFVALVGVVTLSMLRKRRSTLRNRKKHGRMP